MTFDDIRNMTGYSIRRLRQLIKDGLPHGTRNNPHGGKRILIFDQDKVEFYLAGRDLITPKQMEQALNEIAKGTQLKGRLSGGQPSLPPKDNTPTLADLGVSKNESSHAQKLAALPETQFREVVSGAKTMAQVKKAGKAKKTATAKTDIGGPPPDPNAKIKDPNNKVIPAKLLPLWHRGQEIQEILTQISKIRCTIERAVEDKDKLYSEIIISNVKAELDNAYAGIKATKPYCVCPMCQGEGCRACNHRGLIGKFRYDISVPKELKK